ncbi:DUF3231 family protein [Bacillus sp. ISL-41]|uniref:DUF3231 family protein n=1 Tax=Bacillus sp. ISL-41 TaxID=2819127 RepID=UPI002035BA25|nr:DUF3231 family protein [Bacillus sp. ISL-41]
MSICVLKYFLQHIDDSDIKALLTMRLICRISMWEIIKELFVHEQIAIPQGFTDQDVNLKAERLFSGNLYLKYIKNMVGGGLSGYSRMLPNIYR